MIAIATVLIRIMIYAVPALVCAIPFVLGTLWLKIAVVALAPLLASTALVVTAGALSMPFRRAIVAGQFPRRLEDRVYGPRRLYGLCWTAVFYAGPLYQLALTTPALRWLMLRLFGYRGATDITFYSDTWLRDLPLLDIAPGAYLSNKATIGTNICLKNGDILVDRIVVGRGAMVGHLAMLAPGAILEEDVEIGVGVAFGIKARAGAGARIGPGCRINHGAQIGRGVEIGTMAYVGARARIADGIRIPEAAVIPSNTIIATQADADLFARVGESRRTAA